MMVRTSTSWDHDRSGDLESQNIYGLKETGTFVKSLALLPLLKKWVLIQFICYLFQNSL